MSFTLAIIGRPNVGKSTLFNRLIGQRSAIVDDQSGVTRDRKYGECFWSGRTFNVIDTGGFVANSDDIFEKAIREQVQIAIQESSILLFVVDVTTGITDLDEEIARLLRRSNKKVLIAVNKVDNHLRQHDSHEFYSLGFEDVFNIASISGSGTGELLDAVLSYMPEAEEEKDDTSLPKFAIIGRPNVGKSSLVNALVGEPRNIVTNIAGTTRDSVNTHYNLYNKEFILIDTAGIRKKAKVNENLEFYSVMRAINAMDEADVCILLIDATLGLEGQDLNIFRLAHKKRKGILLLVNKWDLIEKDTNTVNTFRKDILERVAPFTDLPIIFISALYKNRIFQAIEEGLKIYERRQQRIATSKLNDVLLEAIERYPPPAVKGKYIRIKYITQLPAKTPVFAFFCNYPRYIKPPYRQYLENKIRTSFDLKGVPIGMVFKQK